MQVTRVSYGKLSVGQTKATNPIRSMEEKGGSSKEPKLRSEIQEEYVHGISGLKEQERESTPATLSGVDRVRLGMHC